MKTLKKAISPPKTTVQVMNLQQQHQQQPDSTRRLSRELNPCGFARVDSYENFDRAEGIPEYEIAYVSFLTFLFLAIFLIFKLFKLPKKFCHFLFLPLFLRLTLVFRLV